MLTKFFSLLKSYSVSEDLHASIMRSVQRENEKRMRYRSFVYMALSSFVLLILSLATWYISNFFVVIPLLSLGIFFIYPFWIRWSSKLRK